MFRIANLRDDLIAAVSVALLAIPLALAIALASGVTPAAGLASAIVAGVVAALFGGAPLAVTGPAAAMAVLIMSVVEHHGMGGLLIITMAVGALQLLTGIFGFGRFARLVPLPVIEGFTAGIGVIILVAQLPRALGLEPPDESHVIDVVTHIGQLFHQTRPASFAVALSAMVLCLFAPRVHRRIPGPLLAVLVPSIFVIALKVEMPRVGTIPRGLELSWPSFTIQWGGVAAPILMVFALASLESLLSAAAVDKLARGARHDPDQEFIGQGLANMASGLFGGIPVTGVIARSALNVHAGGKTRRSALFHAVIVFALMLGAAPWLEQIPVAALAGVLLAVALRMLDPAPLFSLYKTSRADAAVYVVTFVLMVLLDLIEGVQWGLGAAFFVAAIWSSRNHAQLHRSEGNGVHRLVLEGPLTFLSAMKFDSLRTEASQLAPRGTTIIDLSAVNHVDASGAEYLVDFASFLLDQKLRVLILGMRDEVRQRVLSSDHEQRLESLIVDGEADIYMLLALDGGSEPGRLSQGVAAYRRTGLPRYERLFRTLAKTQQKPHTLFITCSDSRVIPTLITASDPGELCILSNIGNTVPRASQRATLSMASLEYALGVLEVADVVVCGHSGCGAINALRNPHTVPDHLPHLLSWVNDAAARKLCDHVPVELMDDIVARMNALLQVDNLRSYAIVRDREDKRVLRLHAWFFDISSGEIENYDFASKLWKLVGDKCPVQALPDDTAEQTFGEAPVRT
jgi:carbonic anhydrase